jgi:hypothetical protein
MKFTISSSLLGLALAFGGTCAMAQDQQPAGGGLEVRGLVSLGLLSGGEKLSSVDVVTGGSASTENVRAGGSTDLRGGVEFALDRWSLQLSAGYVTDGVRADNGKVTFTAYPVEALVHYKIVDAWRIGAGLRAPLSAKYEEGGAGGNFNTGFTAKVTPVVEVEWLITPNIGVKLRGMQESYKVKGTSVKVDGGRYGMTGSFYF